MSIPNPSRRPRSSSTMATRIGWFGCESGFVDVIGNLYNFLTAISNSPTARNSIVMLPSFGRDHQLDTHSLARRGINPDLAADLQCSLTHILKAVPVRGKRHILGALCYVSNGEAAPVIANLAPELLAGEREAHGNRLTAGVPRDVVDGFLENQEEVAALLRIELDLLQFRRDFEIPIDAIGFEHVGSELPHAGNDRAQL